jgi:hypothetical protein
LRQSISVSKRTAKPKNENKVGSLEAKMKKKRILSSGWKRQRSLIRLKHTMKHISYLPMKCEDP